VRVLVVEDEEKISQFLRKGLSEKGYSVETVSDADAALERIESGPYDLLILDLLLPGSRDGLELCREIRARGVPSKILMLTARDTTEDVVRGLDAGADDYLTKPFKFDELLARVRALVRRGGAGRTELLRYGPVELDRLKHKARVDGKGLDLTPKEFHLLQHFLLHPEEVVRRTELLEKVWDMHFDPESNVVDVHVGNLRRKLRQATGYELIETVRGVGFRLQTPDRAEV